MLAACACGLTGRLSAQTDGPTPIIHKIQSANERLEMVVNSSRILTLDKKFSQVQVNNPEILGAAPLSPDKVQISARKPGVTQVNLWDEENQIHSLDVIVFGDTRELNMILHTQFPASSLKIMPASNSVVVSGTVDNPDNVKKIIEIAEDFYPKVINNITVGGNQQVLLHVKVMEVSRTKLRVVGFDFANINGNDIIASGISGLFSGLDAATGTAVTSGGETLIFSAVGADNSFFGVLEALRQNNIAKILASPTLQTVSGRPAFFNVGGEFPILVPQSLGTVSIEFKKFGTQVDFVPIVRGGGRIRLEVRPRVSEIDPSRSVTINEISVPGLRVREVDTGVEMRAGQTLAIAGLVQSRVETENRGVPWISDVPYVGALFRRVREEVNEIELVILVTPQWSEALDPCEVPPGGPGMSTCSPSDWDLYLKGKMEVPCCGDGTCGDCYRCRNVGAFPNVNIDTRIDGPGNYGGEGTVLPEGYEEVHPQGDLPMEVKPGEGGDVLLPAVPDGVSIQMDRYGQTHVETKKSSQRRPRAGTPAIQASNRRNPQNPENARSSTQNSQRRGQQTSPGIIGPIGYDVEK
jgi:pilus assembly protein CpaC